MYRISPVSAVNSGVTSCELGVPVALEVPPVTVFVPEKAVAFWFVSIPWFANCGCMYLKTFVVELKSTTNYLTKPN